MNEKMKSTRKNNAIAHANIYDIDRISNNQSLDEKYRDQFTGLILDTGRGVIGSIKENTNDYEAINEDKRLSSVDKALGKRKILAADIGLGTLGTGSMLGLAWLVKKVFVA